MADDTEPDDEEGAQYGGTEDEEPTTTIDEGDADDDAGTGATE
ncbi:hypothetical protein [Natrinema salsiterrestre]|nr:hypothetical protein [Natrinema salsiterrestre]